VRLPAAAGARPASVVAIVGARAATGRGCEAARALAAGLGAAGVGVVSGGAFGIDAAAHEGALDAGAPTWAVLGCGVDVVYPDRHGPLFDAIAAQGALLSELPPGTPPRARQFPARNRLVVALADAVVVVEAALRSGALITASFARKQGRPLFARPGSPGTDALLRAGAARPLRGAEALLATLAGRQADDGAAGADPDAAPAPPERLGPLLAALGAGPADPGRLARLLDEPVGAIMLTLMEAELEGWVRRLPGNRYEVGHGD
jgi:DNA processing protein